MRTTLLVGALCALAFLVGYGTTAGLGPTETTAPSAELSQLYAPERGTDRSAQSQIAAYRAAQVAP